MCRRVVCVLQLWLLVAGWQGELFVEQSSGGLWSEENLVGGKHDVMKAKKNEEDQSLIFIVMLAWTMYLKVFDLP